MKLADVLGCPSIGLDVVQIADALWLAQFLPAATAEPSPASVGPGAAPAMTHEPSTRSPVDGPPKEAPSQPVPAPQPVDIARVPRAVPVVPGEMRFRSPAASALTGRLALARATRPMAWRTPRPGSWRVVEELTADRIARTDLWLAELEPETEPALDLVVVVDTCPRLQVWRRVTRELMDVLRSSATFRTTTAWKMSGDDVNLQLRTSGGAVRTGPQHLVDASHHTALLVISDFAGPLWRSDVGVACLRLWSRRMILGLVSLLPQRSWRRTLLGTIPATRLTPRRRGDASAALQSEAALVAGAIPVPVLSVDPASLGSWARLVAGDPRVRCRGVLTLGDASGAAYSHYVSEAFGTDEESARELAVLASRDEDPPVLDARARVARFTKSHRPEVVRLAAALASAPLELSVMLVVQRAIAPHTGPLELAEILDSGLFQIEDAVPGDDEVRFQIADDVRDHLGPRTSIGERLRVLETVGAYVRDHLGSSIDFEAMVVDPSRPLGPVADKDQRFARIFVTELRRLGIDGAALSQIAPPAGRPRPLCTLRGHRDVVLTCAVTPRGDRVISASADRTLKIWNVANGQLIATLEGHTDTVNGCAITPDGRNVVSASDDRSIKVWDLATGNALRTLDGHAGAVIGCAVTPDGRSIVSTSADRTVKVWDLDTGTVLATLEGHTGAVRSCAVTPDSHLVVSASNDQTLRVWSLVTGRPTVVLGGNDHWVNSCAITPDGRVVVGATGNVLRLWDLASGALLTTLEGHATWVNGCAVTPDGRYAVSSSNDHALLLWDLATQRRVTSFEGHTGWVRGCAVTGDGRLLVSASSDHTLAIWDLAAVVEQPDARPVYLIKLAEIADQYERLRADTPSSQRRTRKLDELVAAAVRLADQASFYDALAFWTEQRLGTRAVALAMFRSFPAAVPIELLVDTIDQSRTAHEQWTALETLQSVIASRHPLDTDPAIRIVVSRLRVAGGFRGDRHALAAEILEQYLARCLLPTSLASQLDLVEEWLAAGGAVAASARVALVECSSLPSKRHELLATQLVAELGRLGWQVTRSKPDGTDTDDRASASSVVRDMDCVIVLGIDQHTLSAWRAAREHGIVVLAVPLTAGIAVSAFEETWRDLVARGVSPLLLQPLRWRSMDDTAGRIVARIACVMVARTRRVTQPSNTRDLTDVAIALAAQISSVAELFEIAREIGRNVLGPSSPKQVDNLETLNTHRSLSDLASALVRSCQARDRLPQLIITLLRRLPGEILPSARELEMYPWVHNVDGSTGNARLEKVLSDFDAPDPTTWAAECWAVASCVCDVQLDGRTVGTGFLIGPDAILTSYRILEELLRSHGRAIHRRLAFVFDRMSISDRVNAGVSIAPHATAWRLAASPPAHRQERDSRHRDGVDDDLDFALIRTQKSAAISRWHRRVPIDLRSRPPGGQPSAIAIPHYTGLGGLTLSLSLAPALERPSAGPRVRYQAELPPSVAGAPVFDATTWQLLALHLQTTSDGAQHGVPIERIAQHPDVRGYLETEAR